ncbi:MAG: hypothetical protein PHI16_06085, partial [Methanocellales archaeon]|nr:hypothetical protein [Methanocellales archaeon]
MDYKEFLQNKAVVDSDSGIGEISAINPMLYDFQRDIVKWALRRGRACIFADCGLGKTPMQLEWARHIPGNVLIVAPLAVSAQTIHEGEKFGIVVNRSRDGNIAGPITITNYEQLDKFNPDDYAGIVLDESSILKSYTGKYRNMVIEKFGKIKYRLACTATPAPNDFMELGNHAEFMGVMSRTEMLSMFFVHDGGETQKWRIKGHAESVFWKWICSWAVMVKKPSDLGYDDGKFILPELKIHDIVVGTEDIEPVGDFLFRMPASTLQERNIERRTTVEIRAQKCMEIINGSKEPWLIWCNLNDESAALKSIIPDSVEVKGSDSMEHKESAIAWFRGDFDNYVLTGHSDSDKEESEDCSVPSAISALENSKTTMSFLRPLQNISKNSTRKVLISKPKIYGFGLNLQHCNNIAFVGLSDSYEQFYQAIRRCWRFGQKKEVNCYIITADTEGSVVANIKRKEKDSETMAKEMVKNMHEINAANIKGTKRTASEYSEQKKEGKNWTAYLGDTVEMIKELEDESVGYSIFSPPFASLYTYSNSDRDMGNSKTSSEFYDHFKFLVDDLFRVTQSGRLVSFHCMNLPTSKTHDGFIGIKDFRGDLIRMFEASGFIFHSEVCIWKDPVTAMQRTKALGLLHKQIVKDSCMSRQGIPDYLVTMRKPGENKKPVAGELDWFCGEPETFKNTGRLSIDIWQRYAS